LKNKQNNSLIIRTEGPIHMQQHKQIYT